MEVLTILELSNIQRSESLEGCEGEVNRASIDAGWAGVLHGGNDGLALPSDLDLLATVGRLGAGVSIGTVVEGSDEVVVGVLLTTSASVTILREPGDTEIWVRKCRVNEQSVFLHSAGVGLGG